MSAKQPPTPNAAQRGGEAASDALVDYPEGHQPTEGERITDGFALIEPDDDAANTPETIEDLIRNKIPQIDDATVLVLPVVAFVLTRDEYERIAGDTAN